MLRKTSAAIIILIMLSLACVAAQGETMYLDDQGIRFYVPEGWQTITEKNVLESEALATQIGTSAQVMKAQFDAHSILLYAMDENENAFVLRLLESPLQTYSGDVYGFSKGNREEFLQALLAATPNAQGDWDESLSSFICLNWQKDIQGVTVHTLAYQTLMYGKIISFECDSFGQAPTQACAESLKKGAEAILFLGAKASPMQDQASVSNLVLPETTQHEGTAELVVSRDAIPLVLEDLPLTISVSELVVKGTTDPNANLRYYMNGSGIERFKSDDQGYFEITCKKFKEGKNVLRIDASSDNGNASITARINLTQDSTPAMLSTMEITCDTETYDISGLTLPEASVSVKAGSRTLKPAVNEDGTFTVTLPTPNAKDYTFIFDISSALYKKNKLEVVVHRLSSAEEETADFIKQSKKKGSTNLIVNGAVTDLCYDGAKRLVLFTAEDSTSYAIYVEDFLPYDMGKKGQMLLIQTPQTFTLDETVYSVATLVRFNPA